RTAAALATADAAGAAAQFGATVLARRIVESVEPGSNELRLDGGERIGYRALVLALGADPIRIPLEGDGAGDVLSVNDLDDYARFREAIDDARHVTILGAGLIGCEFANDLKLSGRTVEVIEPAAWPLGRLLPQAV